jgi:hypothetical protein
MSNTDSDTVLLDPKDYKKDVRKWRVPILRAPGISVKELYIDSLLIPTSEYSVDGNLISLSKEHDVRADTKARLVVTFVARPSWPFWVPIIVALIGLVGTLSQPALHYLGVLYTRERVTVQQVETKDKKAEIIRAFYDHIDSKQFDDAWALIHKARKLELPQIENSDDFGLLYATTLDHNKVTIEPYKGDKDGNTYAVTFDVRDAFLNNALYRYRDRSVRELIEDEVLNKETIISLILDDLRIYYDVSQESVQRVETAVMQSRLDHLFSPLLISELGRTLSLRPNMDFSSAPRTSAWRHFILHIKLSEDSGNYKIRGGLYPPVAVVAFGPADLPAN